MLKSILTRKQVWANGLFVYIAVVGAILIWAVPSVVQAQETAQVSIDNYVVDPSGSINVMIDLAAENASVAAFKIELTYDPAIVTQVGCELKNFTGVCNEPEMGTILLAGVNVGGIIDDPGLAMITFESTGSAGESSPLRMAVPTLVDVDGMAVDYSVSEGVIWIGQPLSARVGDDSGRVYLPFVGRNGMKQVGGEATSLTPTDVVMTWFCAFMGNFGWTANACYPYM